MILQINGFNVLDANSTNAIYTSNIYEMQRVQNFNSWTDANGLEHRDYITAKITGSVGLIFESAAKFAAFNAAVNRTGTNTVKATVTNTGTDETFTAFVTVSATVTTDSTGAAKYWSATVEVNEA